MFTAVGLQTTTNKLHVIVHRDEASLRECGSRRENDWAVLGLISGTNSYCYLPRISVVSSRSDPSPVQVFAVHQPCPPSSRVNSSAMVNACVLNNV